MLYDCTDVGARKRGYARCTSCDGDLMKESGDVLVYAGEAAPDQRLIRMHCVHVGAYLPSVCRRLTVNYISHCEQLVLYSSSCRCCCCVDSRMLSGVCCAHGFHIVLCLCLIYLGASAARFYQLIFECDGKHLNY